MSNPWPLPDHWHWSDWRSIAHVASDLVDPRGYGAMPHIAPNHIEPKTGRLLAYKTVAEDEVTSPKHLFKPGQILYSKIRPYLAKVAMVDFAGLCSADMYPVETELDPRYLKWWMLTPEFTRQASNQQARTVLPKINKHALGQLPVPVPPLDEQRRAVELVEDYLSRLDAASDGLLKALTRVVSLERSALDTRFSRGTLIPLADLVDDISAGKSFGTSNAPAGEDDWGIIKVSAMTWGRFNPDENKAVPSERADPRFEIREGDLLVSRANTADYVGASVLVGPVRAKLLLSDKSLRLTPKDGVNPEWLWRALQAPSARAQITALATGTKDSMRNISQAALRQILLPKVDEAVQSEALNFFAAVATSTSRLRTDIDACKVRLGNLRRAVLTNAFSGRLTSAASDFSETGKLVGA